MKTTMKKISIISLVVGSVLFSCTSNETENNTSAKVMPQVAETDSLLAVEEGGYNIAITIPKTVLKEDSRFNFRSTFGDLELYVDPKFHLFITDEDLSLASVKEELEQDELFSRKFYNESQDELLYQSVLPDGTEMGFQWMKKIKLEDQSYIIKTGAQADMSKQQIRKIQEFCKTIQLL